MLSILDYLQAGFCISDIDGRMVNADQAYCELLGHDRQSALELTMQSVTHPDDFSSYELLIRRLVRSRSPVVARKRSLHRNGNALWVENRICLLEVCEQPALLVASRAISAPGEEVHAAESPVSVSAGKCAEYIRDMSEQLSVMAGGLHLPTTASMLRLATEVAVRETLEVCGSA